MTPGAGRLRAWFLTSIGMGLAICVPSGVAGQAVDGAFDTVALASPGLDPAREAEIDAKTAEIGSTLRCPVCRQQSVTESTSRIAREMQGLIRSMLIDGSTPAEIEEYFVEAYGPWILLKPRATGVNLFVYLGPLAAFVIGGILLARRLRGGRSTMALEAPAEDAADHLSERDRAWIDAAVRGS